MHHCRIKNGYAMYVMDSFCKENHKLSVHKKKHIIVKTIEPPIVPQIVPPMDSVDLDIKDENDTVKETVLRTSLRKKRSNSETI